MTVSSQTRGWQILDFIPVVRFWPGQPANRVALTLAVSLRRVSRSLLLWVALTFVRRERLASRVQRREVQPDDAEHVPGARGRPLRLSAGVAAALRPAAQGDSSVRQNF